MAYVVKRPDLTASMIEPQYLDLTLVQALAYMHLLLVPLTRLCAAPALWQVACGLFSALLEGAGRLSLPLPLSPVVRAEGFRPSMHLI